MGLSPEQQAISEVSPDYAIAAAAYKRAQLRKHTQGQHKHMGHMMDIMNVLLRVEPVNQLI